MNIQSFEQKGTNLYKLGSKYFRLQAHGITPNSCWLINPAMIRLIDIDVKTGADIFGAEKIELGNGTVSAYYRYTKV